MCTEQDRTEQNSLILKWQIIIINKESVDIDIGADGFSGLEQYRPRLCRGTAEAVTREPEISI